MRRFAAILFISIAAGPAIVATCLAKGPDTLWTRTYGGPYDDIGHKLTCTSDGGYIIVGRTSEDWPYRRHAYLVKTTQNGDIEWEYSFVGTRFEYGMAVVEASDGGYIYAGDVEQPDFEDVIFLSKLDTAGLHRWKRTYKIRSDDGIEALDMTADGGYFIAGHTDDVGSWPDIFLIKTDSDGETVWTRTYGGDDNERAYSCLATSDGGCLLAGYKSWPEWWWYVGGLYLLKTNTDGDTLWTKLYNIPGVGAGTSIARTSDQCYVICALRDRWPGYETADHLDCFVMKIDADGDSLWTTTWGSDSCQYAPEEIIETNDGGYAVVSTAVYSGDTKPDMYLAKLTADGDTSWTRVYGGAGYEHGASVKQADDGSYLIAGLTTSFGAGGADVFLIKTFPEGDTAPSSHLEASLPWPNPLLGSTSLSLGLARPERVTVSLYDVSGRYLCSLLDKTVAAGSRRISLDFTQPPANTISAGVYCIRVQAGDRIATRKLVLVR